MCETLLNSNPVDLFPVLLKNEFAFCVLFPVLQNFLAQKLTLLHSKLSCLTLTSISALDYYLPKRLLAHRCIARVIFGLSCAKMETLSRVKHASLLWKNINYSARKSCNFFHWKFWSLSVFYFDKLFWGFTACMASCKHPYQNIHQEQN
jgi:hypothetical protein